MQLIFNKDEKGKTKMANDNLNAQKENLKKSLLSVISDFNGIESQISQSEPTIQNTDFDNYFVYFPRHGKGEMTVISQGSDGKNYRMTIEHVNKEEWENER